MLFQTYTKLMFGLPDVFVVTVIARNRINGIGSFIEMRSFQTFWIEFYNERKHVISVLCDLKM